MATPTVSVILSRQHQEDHLQDALESLRAQTLFDYELIIRDSANQAIGDAQGEFVAFLDSDHLWQPRKLETQIARLVAAPDVQWCYCHAQTLGSKTAAAVSLPAGHILRPLLLSNFIPPSSVAARRELFVAEKLTFQNHWDMCLRLAASHPVGFVPESLVQLRDQSLDSDDIERLYSSQVRVVETAVKRHPAELADLRSYALAQICVSAGNNYLKANNRTEARHKFAEALTHNSLFSDAYLSWAASFLSTEAQQQVRDLQALAHFSQAGVKRARQAAMHR